MAGKFLALSLIAILFAVTQAQNAICPTTPAIFCPPGTVNSISTNYSFPANMSFPNSAFIDGAQFSFVSLGPGVQNFLFSNISISFSTACPTDPTTISTFIVTAGNFSFLNVAPGVLISSDQAIGGLSLGQPFAAVGPDFGTCGGGPYLLVSPVIFNFVLSSTVPGTQIILFNNVQLTTSPNITLNSTSERALFTSNDLRCFTCPGTPIFEVDQMSPIPNDTSINSLGLICTNYNITNLASSSYTFVVNNVQIVFLAFCQFDVNTGITSFVPAQTSATYTLAPGQTANSGNICSTNGLPSFFCIDSSYFFIQQPVRFSAVVTTTGLLDVPVGLSFSLGVDSGNGNLIFTGGNSTVTSTTNPACNLPMIAKVGIPATSAEMDFAAMLGPKAMKSSPFTPVSYLNTDHIMMA